MSIIKRILCVSVIASALATPLFCEDSIKPKMVRIPGKNYEMMTTEVTQELYESVMGENPSWFRNDNEKLPEYFRNVLKNGTKNHPVENVSWYDAIYFCNKLSEKEGLEPVYAVNNKKSVSQWNYKPHRGNEIEGKITHELNANGYRLPMWAEWQYAAKGGMDYAYAGSDDIDEVAWYYANSDYTHPVGQKKANGYGLYDMSGNVWEWCWDVSPSGSHNRYTCGGSWYNISVLCEVGGRNYGKAIDRDNDIGFRLVRTIK